MPHLVKLPEGADWRGLLGLFDDCAWAEEIRFGRMGDQDHWYVSIRISGLEYVRRLDDPHFAAILVDILDNPKGE